MKKQITLLLAAIVFMGFSSQAQVPCEILNEWTFDTDSVDTLLSAAINTGTAGATFSPVSGDETILKTDGSGILQNTPTATALWADGATLDADVTDASSGVHYMRYDLEYDLLNGDHEVGTTLGISFVDTAGTEVAGMALSYSSYASAPAGMIATPVVEGLPLSGTLSAIAEVDLGAGTISVWYDLLDANAFIESAPAETVSGISLASIGDLRIRSTGEVNPGGAGDFVNVDMIRTANCWEEIAGTPEEIISFQSVVVTNMTDTGLIDGELEPGEAFDVIVVSVNDGVLAVNNMTNSLVAANPAFFSITPSSYPYLWIPPAGAVTSTYHVVCSASTPNGLHALQAINRTALGSAWTNTFEVDVINRAVPSVSTHELTLRVAPGEMASGTLTLSNTGNAPALFSVIDDGMLPLGGYQVVTQNTSMVSFNLDSGTGFTGWDADGYADWLDLGFGFGATGHNEFRVNEKGALELRGGGGLVVVTPFWRSMPFDRDSISYKRMADDRLVIDWGNGTETEMQAWLYPDGTLRFLYNYGTWGDGLISFTALNSGQVWNSAECGQIISYIPGGSGNDSLFFTPKSSWVSYGPSSGTVLSEGSQDLIFIADASGFRPPEINTFDVTVHWAGGGSDVVTVTVLVEEKISALGVPPFFSFEGPAGLISPPSFMTVINTGNTTLDYTIIDSGMAGAGYIQETAAYDWVYIPPVADFMLYAADLGVAPVEIGFPFVFFGATYTRMIVGADGTLYLGDTARIAPFSAGLLLDGNASVRVFTNPEKTRCTVTWENMQQPGGDLNQTFQAMLHRDGLIRFNYKQMGDSWPNGAIFLADGYVVEGTLRNEATTRVEEVLITQTNTVTRTIGNVSTDEEVVTVIGTNEVVTFLEANRQAIEFMSGQPRIITFSPESGTILPGETADIRLIGDARSLTSGGSNPVEADTRLMFLTQPPPSLSRLSLVDDGSDDLEWEKVSYNVYLLSKNAGAEAPLPGKPSVVYFDGEPVQGLPDDTDLSIGPGPKWSWADHSGKGWYTLQVRLPWAGETLLDPDSRDEGYLKIPIPVEVGVNFTATNSTETAYPDPAVQAAMWGFADPVVSSQQNPDGSRTLSWPPAEDGLSRTYTVLYTTSLSSPWNLLATLSNSTSYMDSIHNDEPAIFYKVTVQ